MPGMQAWLGQTYFLAHEEYRSVEGQIQKIIEMCGSWWEGKLRLQNKKAVHALCGLEPFPAHFHSFLLPYRSHSIGSHTNKPGVKLLHQHHCGMLPQIPVVILFIFFSPTRSQSCSFCKHSYILPWVKMSICWNLAESKISSFPGPDRFYPSSMSHHHLNQLLLAENFTENCGRSGKWGLFS